ncbi:macrophage colony-stimulating factor 1a [Brachyhypopomus gauderio]|uniref:macrophage colony-stimulating factor 1a n=1 Tax=Brachyhypopomus gauderio TaxID=698409 RepID=UPI0040412DE3
MNTHTTSRKAKIRHLCFLLVLLLPWFCGAVLGPCKHSVTEDHLLTLRRLIANQLQNGCSITYSFIERQNLSEVCYIKAAFPHILDLLTTNLQYAKESDNYRYTSSLKNLIYNIYSHKCIHPLNEEIENNPVKFTRVYSTLPRVGLEKAEEVIKMYKNLVTKNDSPVEWNCGDEYAEDYPESTSAFPTQISATAVSPSKRSLVPVQKNQSAGFSTPEPVVKYGTSNSDKIHPDLTSPNPNLSPEIYPDLTSPNPNLSSEIYPDLTSPNPNLSSEIHHDLTSPKPNLSSEIHPDLTSPNSNLYSEIYPDLTSPNSNLSSEIHHDLTSPNPNLSSEIYPDLTSPNSNLSSEVHPDLTSPNSNLYSEIYPDLTSPNSNLSSEIHHDLTSPNPNLSSEIYPDLTSPKPNLLSEIHPDLTSPNSNLSSEIHPDLTSPNPNLSSEMGTTSELFKEETHSSRSEDLSSPFTTPYSMEDTSESLSALEIAPASVMSFHSTYLKELPRLSQRRTDALLQSTSQRSHWTTRPLPSDRSPTLVLAKRSLDSRPRGVLANIFSAMLHSWNKSDHVGIHKKESHLHVAT